MLRAVAKLTTKGRVTLPTEVRDRLGVKPGDTVIFERKDGTIFIRFGRRGSSPRASRS